jgi:hypothetical protein
MQSLTDHRNCTGWQVRFLDIDLLRIQVGNCKNQRNIPALTLGTHNTHFLHIIAFSTYLQRY